MEVKSPNALNSSTLGNQISPGFDAVKKEAPNPSDTSPVVTITDVQGKKLTFYHKGRHVCVNIGEVTGSDYKTVHVRRFSGGFISGVIAYFFPTLRFIDSEGKKWAFRTSRDELRKYFQWLSTPRPFRELLPDEIRVYLEDVESSGASFDIFAMAEVAPILGVNRTDLKQSAVLVAISDTELLLCRQNDTPLPVLSQKFVRIPICRAKILAGAELPPMAKGYEFGRRKTRVCGISLDEHQSAIYLVLPADVIEILIGLSKGTMRIERE